MIVTEHIQIMILPKLVGSRLSLSVFNHSQLQKSHPRKGSPLWTVIPPVAVPHGPCPSFSWSLILSPTV